MKAQAQNKNAKTEKHSCSGNCAGCSGCSGHSGDGKSCSGKKKEKKEMVLTNGGNHIVMKEGATLTLLESDSGCYKRLIKMLLNRPDITDAEFRAAVRSITE